MSNDFGIKVNIKSKATRNITPKSSTIIAIAGKINGKNNFFKSFDSASKALESSNLASKQGSIIDALKDIETQNVNCKVFLSANNNSKQSVEKLKNCKSEFGEKPSLIIAANLVTESDNSVNVHIKTLLDKFGNGSIGIIDLKAKNLNEAKAEIQPLIGGEAGKRLFPIYSSNCYTKNQNNYVEKKALSAIVAGAIARKDSENEFGYAMSPSMTNINGIVKGGVDFESGSSNEANEFRKNGINCIINPNNLGFRIWGDCTLSSDQIWKDIKRVRIFDKIEEAFLTGLTFVIDKNASSSLTYVQDSVESYLRNLTGASVLSGFNFQWDGEKNTKENILNGKFFLNIDAQEMPSVKSLEINLYHTDSFYNSVIKVA